MPRTSPYPTKVKPQGGKSNCSKSLCESHDDIIQHVAAAQGMRMADDDPWRLTIHIRAHKEPLASHAVSRKGYTLALYGHGFLPSDCGHQLYTRLPEMEANPTRVSSPVQRAYSRYPYLKLVFSSRRFRSVTFSFSSWNGSLQRTQRFNRYPKRI